MNEVQGSRRPTPMESALGLKAVRTDVAPIHRVVPLGGVDTDDLRGMEPPPQVSYADPLSRGINLDHKPSPTSESVVKTELEPQVPPSVQVGETTDVDVKDATVDPAANFGGKIPDDNRTESLGEKTSGEQDDIDVVNK